MLNLPENPLRLKSPVDETLLPHMEKAVMLDILDRWENRHGVIPDDMSSPVDKVLLSMVGPNRTKVLVGGSRQSLGSRSPAFLDDAVLSLRENFNVADHAEAVERIEERWLDLSFDWDLVNGNPMHRIRLPDPGMAAAVLKQARRIRECEREELAALNDAMNAGAFLTPGQRERYMSALAATDEAKRGLSMFRRTLSSIIDRCAAGWQSTQGQPSLGLRTPRFARVSDMLFGWRGLTFVAAMPGIGKTTLALAAGIDAVENNDDACFVFLSFEMPTRTLVDRVLSDMSGIPQRTLHVGVDYPNAVESAGLRLLEKQHRDIGEAMTRLSCMSDRVALIGKDDIGTLRGQSSDGRDCMSAVLQAVEEVKRHSGKSRSFVVLDHLGVIPVERGDGEPFAADTDRTRYVLSGLTTLRDRLDGERNPVVVVAQARKSDWKGKAVDLASIMGTADTAYSADAAIVMYRPADENGEQAEPDWTRPQPLVAKVAKGRDMMRYGEVRMTFDPTTSSLTEDAE
jgi:hypothetical protein